MFNGTGIFAQYLTNQGREINKWAHYFPVYEKYFSQWKNKSLTLLEIGVGSGGSLEMWYRYFGPYSRIVGIDIDFCCKNVEKKGIDVRIGNQSDINFLKSVDDEFGPFDIIIDDGSHKMNDIIASFDFFYPRLSKNGIYIVEDTHTSYMKNYGGGINNENNFVNISKHLIDQLNGYYSNGELTQFTDITLGVHFYDSMIVFERGNIPHRYSYTCWTGTQPL